MNLLKCFHKPSIVDQIKTVYIENHDIDDSTELMIKFLYKNKFSHPVANMHYNALISQTNIKTPSMIMEHDSAYEWIIKYEAASTSSVLCFWWPCY